MRTQGGGASPGTSGTRGRDCPATGMVGWHLRSNSSSTSTGRTPRRGARTNFRALHLRGRDTHLRGDGTSAGGMRNKDGSKTAWNHVGQVTQETKIPDSVIRIMRHKGKIGQDIDHPAVFPVALPQFVLESYTDAGEIVFEPFCGSGTPCWPPSAPAERYAPPRSPGYVDVTVKRFQQNFPEVPVTLGDGQTFDGGHRASGRCGMTISWLADKIEQWPTAKLVPYARNSRTHSDAQVAQIAASIAEFGFTNPILAGGDGVIVAGHGRLAAAQKLGSGHGAGRGARPSDPTQRRALVIADNRIAENAGWDEAMLQVELAALQDDQFDLALTGSMPMPWPISGRRGNDHRGRPMRMRFRRDPAPSYPGRATSGFVASTG